MRRTCLDHGLTEPPAAPAPPACPACGERLYDLDVPDDRKLVTAYVGGVASTTMFRGIWWMLGCSLPLYVAANVFLPPGVGKIVGLAVLVSGAVITSKLAVRGMDPRMRQVLALVEGEPLPLLRTFLTGTPFLFGIAVLLIHAFASPEVVRALGLLPLAVRAGDRLETLLTHTLVHGSAGHVLGNVVFLSLFGAKVNQRLGRAWTVVVVLAAGLGCGLAQTFITRNPEVMAIGASGVVYGMIGAGLALFPRARSVISRSDGRAIQSHWTGVAFFLAVFVLGDILISKGVAVLGHLGGLAGGFLVALPLRRVPPTPLYVTLARRAQEEVAELEALDHPPDVLPPA